MPKLSIIIPVYNAAAYLPQTLESILRQSLKDIEVICVDDGSTDDSVPVIRSYAQQDSRVQLLTQSNQHAGVARNRGLAAATGEFVHFLDADDYVLDYAYEALYNKMVKYELDCLKFASAALDPQRDTFVDLPSFTLRRLRPGDFNRLLTLDEGSPIFKINVAPWNGMYRRSFLLEKNLSFNDLYCVNDRSFFWQVITNASRMMIARDILVIHRVALSDSLIGVRDQHFDCHFRSIALVEQRLGADGVAVDVAARILTKDFTDLFNWALEYRENADIAAQVESFVSSYSGAYRDELEECYLNYRLALRKGPEAKEPPAPVMLFHEQSEHPKVSVVIPTFNVEDYLNEALYSLTVQTEEDLEFLCVNDGSTDHSLTIIKEYANIDKRFQILDGPNGGYGKAMNRGINAATGEFLGILEPDDYVRKDMFERLYNVANKHDLDFVKADFYRFTINPDGSMDRKRNNLSHDPADYGHLVNPSEDIHTFTYIMNTWSGIYRMSFLNKYNIRHNETPGASYQDNGFWFQTFCRATRAWFVKKPFYMNRRDNPNSSMFNKNKLYCVTNEYKYIWDWMSKEPELVKRFSDIFYMKKYANFMVTYRRVAENLRPEYLHHICDEFGPAMREGKLNRKLFGEGFWKQLNEILADPDAYYEKLRVSVIIPVYNTEAYLRQCLDSLLIRNEIRMEVICVDDGSTDRSLEILREYEAKDPRVVVLTQKNAGAGAARNHGMEVAKGEYLSFLDADDFFSFEMIRRAYEKADVDGDDIVVFRSQQYFADTNTYAPMPYTINEKLLPLKQPFAGTDIPKDTFKVFVGWAWDKLFRADFVRENHLRFQEQRTSNDMLFVFSAITKAKRISTMNAVMASHRREGGSLSVTREKSWDCFYHALCALRQQLKDWGTWDRFERDFVNYAVHFSLWNVTTIKGASYYRLFEKLHDEWAEDLGITAHDRRYFYNKGEYDKMMRLLSCTADEFLFAEMDEAKGMVGDLRKEVAALTQKVEKLEARNEKLEGQKAKLELTRKELKSQISALKKQEKKMRRSAIWRVGRIVTWPLRKLRKLFKKK